MLIDFAQHDATRAFSYPLAGPDGIALRPGLLAVAEYGEGRVHLFDRDGQHLNTLKVSMPFVDTVIWDDVGQSLRRRGVPEHPAAVRGRGGAVSAKRMGKTALKSRALTGTAAGPCNSHADPEHSAVR